MKVRSLKKEDGNELAHLFNQLTKKPTLDIDQIIGDPNCTSVAVEISGKLIGVGFLVTHLVPCKGYVGKIEDVVVDQEQREKGLGKIIMNELIETAKEKKLKFLNLTSNPSRIPARKLYESLGFKLRDTGLFSMEL